MISSVKALLDTLEIFSSIPGSSVLVDPALIVAVASAFTFAVSFASLAGRFRFFDAGLFLFPSDIVQVWLLYERPKLSENW